MACTSVVQYRSAALTPDMYRHVDRIDARGRRSRCPRPHRVEAVCQQVAGPAKHARLLAGRRTVHHSPGVSGPWRSRSITSTLCRTSSRTLDHFPWGVSLFLPRTSHGRRSPTRGAGRIRGPSSGPCAGVSEEASRYSRAQLRTAVARIVRGFDAVEQYRGTGSYMEMSPRRRAIACRRSDGRASIAGDQRPPPRSLWSAVRDSRSGCLDHRCVGVVAPIAGNQVGARECSRHLTPPVAGARFWWSLVPRKRASPARRAALVAARRRRTISPEDDRPGRRRQRAGVDGAMHPRPRGIAHLQQARTWREPPREAVSSTCSAG
jgi:hypothetical protein